MSWTRAHQLLLFLTVNHESFASLVNMDILFLENDVIAKRAAISFGAWSEIVILMHRREGAALRVISIDFRYLVLGKHLRLQCSVFSLSSSIVMVTSVAKELNQTSPAGCWTRNHGKARTQSLLRVTDAECRLVFSMAAATFFRTNPKHQNGALSLR